MAQVARAVTFDLWQTLILDMPNLEAERARLRREAMRAAFTGSGHDVPGEVLDAAYHSVIDSYNQVWDTLRDLSHDEQIELLVQRLDADVSRLVDQVVKERLANGFHEVIATVPPTAMEGAVSVLEELKAAGYRLGLICNTGRTPGSALRPVLRKMGILRLLDVDVFSNEVGWRKPDERIFQATLRGLGVAPEDAIHVGDNPWTDIFGAHAAGMRAVLFSTYHPATVPGWVAYDAPPPDFQGSTEPDAEITALSELSGVIRQLNATGAVP